ncbi:MAG TPA: hypothetical protein VFB12_26600 [Ktedonobacteraceae bacterium]|nr:hypothetical protein [Ktedonobacteraceae bacterium]
MSIEEKKLLNYHPFVKIINMTEPDHDGDERHDASKHVELERSIFHLVLAIITEPSKLGQLRQMLVHLQEQQVLPETFSCWAIEQVDERILSIALEYAHDAELLVQILSFKGGTFDDLMHTIEDLYQQEKISQRLCVRAKLLLRTHEPPQQE